MNAIVPATATPATSTAAPAPSSTGACRVRRVSPLLTVVAATKGSLPGRGAPARGLNFALGPKVPTMRSTLRREVASAWGASA
jgi:hypothetical protein